MSDLDLIGRSFKVVLGCFSLTNIVEAWDVLTVLSLSSSELDNSLVADCVVVKTGKVVSVPVDLLKDDSRFQEVCVQEEGAKVMKYKVGDQVKVIVDDETNCLGLIGVVVDINPQTGYEYEVEVCGRDLYFKKDELELVKEVIENTSARQYNPLEVQEGGGHYKGKGIQPLEYANANNLNPQKFNIVKYITRHEEKNQVEDLSKVIHYALLEAYFQYGVEGSTELKQRVLKMLGAKDD